MDLPQLENADGYVGLYVIDFGDHSATGYTADEVATLLESQAYAEVKVYRIHRAYADGRLELAGVPCERFQLESGMFFHCRSETSGRVDFDRLRAWAEQTAAPCRAKLQLVRSGDDQVVLALVYPAEYEEAMGRWVAASGYEGSGAVDAGVSQVVRFREQRAEVLAREQLWPAERLRGRSLEEPRRAVGETVQR